MKTIAYFEQALALDPRNVQALVDSALTYGMLRQFPKALKLYDRALEHSFKRSGRDGVKGQYLSGPG